MKTSRDISNAVVGQDAIHVIRHGGSIGKDTKYPVKVIRVTKTMVEASDGNKYSRKYGYLPGTKLVGLGYTQWLELVVK